jgi:hypothetical protein
LRRNVWIPVFRDSATIARNNGSASKRALRGNDDLRGKPHKTRDSSFDDFAIIRILALLFFMKIQHLRRFRVPPVVLREVAQSRIRRTCRAILSFCA